jgi:hypothetical protein
MLLSIATHCTIKGTCQGEFTPIEVYLRNGISQVEDKNNIRFMRFLTTFLLPKSFFLASLL